MVAACLVPFVVSAAGAMLVVPSTPGLAPLFVAWPLVALLVGLAPLRIWWVSSGLGIVPALPLFVAVIAINFEPMHVNGQSMQPTLQPADVVLVDRRAQGIETGGLYVIRRLMEPDRVMVKRAVGLPGQTLEARNGRLFADGVEVHPRVGGEHWNDERPVYAELYLARPLTLGEDEYFFIGDNPGSSRDSRREGPYSGGQIEGRVVWRLTGTNGAGPLLR
jgi:signal peptidase I